MTPSVTLESRYGCIHSFAMFEEMSVKMCPRAKVPDAVLKRTISGSRDSFRTAGKAVVVEYASISQQINIHSISFDFNFEDIIALKF